MLSCQSFISDKARYMSEKLLPTEIDLSPFEPALFAAMRRLQQAGEVHAKRLARFGGLTPMQLMILRVMEGEGRMTASGLSRRVSLSAATLSGMLERLEERGLLLRQRDEEDRRRQWLSVSEAGRALLVAAPRAAAAAAGPAQRLCGAAGVGKAQPDRRPAAGGGAVWRSRLATSLGRRRGWLARPRPSAWGWAA